MVSTRLDDIKIGINYQKREIEDKCRRLKRDYDKLALKEQVINNLIDLFSTLEYSKSNDYGIVTAIVVKEFRKTSIGDLGVDKDSGYQEEARRFLDVCKITKMICSDLGIKYNLGEEQFEHKGVNSDNQDHGALEVERRVRITQNVEVSSLVFSKISGPEVSMSLNKVLKRG